MEKIQRQNALSETDKSESELQEAFKHLDKDNDGLVTYDDVVTALKNEGVRDGHKFKKETRLGSIRSSPRYGLSTPYRLTIRNSASPFF